MTSTSFESLEVQRPQCEEISFVIGRANLLHSPPKGLNDALWVTGTVLSFSLQLGEGLIFKPHFESHVQIIGGMSLLSSTVLTFS